MNLKILAGLLIFLLVVAPVHAGITYSDPVITLDAVTASLSDIYDDADVPASALYPVNTTDGNISWVLNQTRIVINAGAGLYIELESLTVDYDISANARIIDNSGFFSFNQSSMALEVGGIGTKVLWPVRTLTGGTSEIYDSHFTTNSDDILADKVRGIRNEGGTTWINRTTLVNMQVGLQPVSGDLIATDIIMTNVRTPIVLSTTATIPWSNILLTDVVSGYRTYNVASKTYNLKQVNCGDPEKGLYCWDQVPGAASVSHYLGDSDLGNWSSVEILNSGIVKYEFYTFNLKVKESNVLESYLSGVNVTLYNRDGTTAFSVLTDADGEIAEQEPDFRKWIYTGSNPVPVDTEYYPFSLVLTKSGYQDVNLSINYSVIEGRETEGIDLEMAMLPTVASTAASDQDAINQPPSATHHIKTVGTPYTTSDTVTIGAMVINGSTGQAIGVDNVTLTVYYPNGSQYFQNQMTQLSGSDPIIYNYSFAMPGVRGVYLYTLNSSNPVADAMGETQNINWSLNNITAADIWGYSNRTTLNYFDKVTGGDIMAMPLLLLITMTVSMVLIAEWKNDRWLYLFSTMWPLMMFFYSITNNPFADFTTYKLDMLWLFSTLILTIYMLIRAGLGQWDTIRIKIQKFGF